MISAVWLVLFSILAVFAGYRFYGDFVSKRLGIDNKRKTPAHEMNDGIDYVPSKAPVLLGHHFASIAGASPIIGPIVAAVFGWVPVLLWIIIGGIFMGAVHDYSTLVISVRHKGRLFSEVIEERIGRDGKKLFLVFSFFMLILVIAAFMIIVARTFTANPSAGSASIMFIILAVFFGFSIYKKQLPLGITTVIGVVLLFLCVYLGLRFPLELSFNTWLFILISYSFIAATTPVWILLQPRDYLNSFLLYVLMFGAFVGIIIANPTIKLEAFSGFKQDIGYMFPLLFVTVACGAISGFHSLVASGTTAKQLNSEKDAKLIGYGGMLIESLLAVLAIITAASLTRAEYGIMISDGPVALFSQGIGQFLSHMSIPLTTGTTFAALAVSAFALTSLDTATRLCRFVFQEFFSTGRKKETSKLVSNRYIGTAVTLSIAGALAVSGKWQAIWPLFGSANQLLAAIALLAVTVWLGVRGVKFGFTLLPMVFMFIVTVTALVFVFWKNFSEGQYLLAVLSIFLMIVAVILIGLAIKRFGFRKTAS